MTCAEKSDPIANLDEIREFFTKSLGSEIHLTAITGKSRRCVARDFGCDVEAALQWAQEKNASGMGLYYSVNRVRSGLNKKATKADLLNIRFAHLDLDPPKGVSGWTPAERDQAYDRLLNAPLPPPCIIWSGNGLQALWALEEGVSIEAVEDINKVLIALLGGDKGTHNADRILRVPGLVNWPSELKKTWGRQPALARIEAENDGSFYTLKEMQAAFPAATEAETLERPHPSPGELTSITADSLGLGADDALRSMIEKPKGADRSAATFAFACEALRGGLTPEQVGGVLLNAANPISAHCLDQPDPHRAVERAIVAAMAEEDVRLHVRKRERERERSLAAGEAAEPHDGTRLWTLEDMLHGCVFIEDGSQVADTTRPGHVLSQSDFRASTAASKMKVMIPAKNGSERSSKKRIAEVWLEHVNRRTVATVTFRPGAGAITTAPGGQTALNNWGGFRSTNPPQGWEIRAQPFEAHIRWLWGVDADAFFDWLAHLAQKPGDLPSFGWLHIARHQGMGRNWIASILGRVFIGFVALAYDLSGTLRTGYNGMLAGTLLAIVDEIDEGNSQRKYQIQQELKQLVTEETRTINPKYGRQHREWNCCRWLIFSNSPSALPLEDDDRRIYVVECEDVPKEEAHYKLLYRLKDDPAFIASVAEFLLRRDVTHFNAGQRPPLTLAKVALLERGRSEAEQILHSAAARWVVDIITSDELHDLMGEERPRGPALRHALDRAGIVRVGEWKGDPNNFGTRLKVKAYALRNIETWKGASPAAIKAEVGRIDRAAKEAAFYGI